MSPRIESTLTHSQDYSLTSFVPPHSLLSIDSSLPNALIFRSLSRPSLHLSYRTSQLSPYTPPRHFSSFSSPSRLDRHLNNDVDERLHGSLPKPRRAMLHKLLQRFHFESFIFQRGTACLSLSISLSDKIDRSVLCRTGVLRQHLCR